MSNDPIVILESKIEPDELSRLVHLFFGDMVKFVIDVDKCIAAVGGALHADAEVLLLDQGSLQESLWGGNYFPGLGRDGCIQYTSLINIRPNQGNRGMEIDDPGVRDRVREITLSLIGEGEVLD